jgi:hypothetical protein
MGNEAVRLKFDEMPRERLRLDVPKLTEWIANLVLEQFPEDAIKLDGTAAIYKHLNTGYRIELPFKQHAFKANSNHTAIGLVVNVQAMTKSVEDSFTDNWEFNAKINKNKSEDT